MAITSKTITVDVDVDTYIEDFDDEDLIDELRDRGYTVSDTKKSKKEFSWLKPSQEEDEVDDILWALRQAYILEGDDQFRKSFKEILAGYGYYT
jgi:hypothetical protein